MSVHLIRHVLLKNAVILALEHNVGKMHCVMLIITLLNVLAQKGSKETHMLLAFPWAAEKIMTAVKQRAVTGIIKSVVLCAQ
jgi:hypothetical protein